jgi:hypothetical protein
VEVAGVERQGRAKQKSLVAALDPQHKISSSKGYERYIKPLLLQHLPSTSEEGHGTSPPTRAGGGGGGGEAEEDKERGHGTVALLGVVACQSPRREYGSPSSVGLWLLGA